MCVLSTCVVYAGMPKLPINFLYNFFQTYHDSVESINVEVKESNKIIASCEEEFKISVSICPFLPWVYAHVWVYACSSCVDIF